MPAPSTGPAPSGPQWHYARRRPEHTLLYQLVNENLEPFLEQCAQTDRRVPVHVEQGFRRYLDCGRLECGFLRLRCERCRDEKLVAFSCKDRGLCPSCGASRMAHYDWLLGEVLLPKRPYRQWVLSLPYALRLLLAYHPQLHEREQPPRLSERLDPEPFVDVMAHSIAYRIAMGPLRGRKVLTLQTPAARRDESEPAPELSARNRLTGFSLHAGVSTQPHETKKLKRLIRYLARPPVAEHRLSMDAEGQVVYLLKTPFRDGTTHAVFQPVDFIARLAALIPRPRAHLVRYHGLFAPNHRQRALVVNGSPEQNNKEPGVEPAAPRHRLSWAERLKRVFKLDLSTCCECGGPLRLIAVIEQPSVIERILAHLERQSSSAGSRAPPLSTGGSVQLRLFC